ncbi:RNA-binding S4 domain-containing protein [Luteimonas terrae]|uniref:RNA-binding S4 domain-containing protein n=1 Tax=Luteimonas terrae TaxID=1530191 RepID=A0A4R5UEH6_9GAMM|nr:RNA-binding S4 domain-containing protein [Luteimonas terrae]TDK33717.1 RNA-binding S4 domain-containing protein [Luteimonas terrae]
MPTPIEIPLEGGRDHVELNQLLKLAGLCDSGGAGKAIVASGAVFVDGAVELRKTCKIRAGQTVELDGHVVQVIAGI